MLEEIFSLLDEGRSSFNAVDWLQNKLKAAGFQYLDEKKDFKLDAGGHYYTVRNGSSIIAFKVPQGLSSFGFRITASHNDCPGFKLKPEALIKEDNYYKLNTEVYGGPIYSTWFDRPLSLAGRVIVEKDHQLAIKHIDFKRPLCIIPSLAIHLNPECNKGRELNPQVDLLPLASLGEKGDLKALLAEELKASEEDIINFDLYLYPCQKALNWGEDKEFITAHHLDDLASAFAAFKAFMESDNSQNIDVFACFDNEEVGSLTRQGAFGDFARLTFSRIAKALNFDESSAFARSMMLSCDNAHAIHPNHREKSDLINYPCLNKGIVIKYNANQSYTSDSLSASIFIKILKDKDIPYQFYANRSDIRGGSTLGNLSNNQVSLLSLDIGIAQLAMHSCLETCGSRDIDYMIAGLKAFYESNFKIADESVEF